MSHDTPLSPLSRRDLLRAASCGFGYLAFASLSTEAALAAARNPLAPRKPHFAPKAKRVIFLCMSGGPSHVDTFDYKPKLQAAGEKADATAGKVRGKGGKLLASPWKFSPHGQSGLDISELFSHVAKHADDLCLLNGMHTDVPNHPQSFLMLHTGEFRFTRPSLGSWLLYGLGTENQDLPGFVTINPPPNLGGAQNYSNAFLPAAFQGARLGGEEARRPKAARAAAVKVGNLSSSLSSTEQRRQLDLLQAMNQDLLARKKVHPEVEGVIDSFELGFRMQRSLPKLMDLSGESAKTLQAYGIGAGPTNNFGRQCLMARRFAEAGVRFIELGHGGWDTHGNLTQRLPQLCRQIDQPIAALLADLKQRGLLEDTLVMWGGEFGRTPTGQGTNGRNHNAAGYTMWLAGGGVKGGQRVGATDETGARAVENRMHVHDLHAMVLHLLGLDHQKLTFRYGGRDYSLTDIHGRVVKEVMG
jgi:hypothetical protein